MHEAIGLGKLPKLDPWAEVVKAFKPPSPKPAPAQTQQQEGLCTGTYTLSETHLDWYRDATKELDDSFAKVELLNTLLDREDRAIERMRSAMSAQQAPAIQPFGSYETAATTGGYSSHYPLPTEPRPRSPQPTALRRRRRGGLATTTRALVAPTRVRDSEAPTRHSCKEQATSEQTLLRRPNPPRFLHPTRIRDNELRATLSKAYNAQARQRA